MGRRPNAAGRAGPDDRGGFAAKRPGPRPPQPSESCGRAQSQGSGALRDDGTHSVVKRFGSIYADTDVEQWLRDNEVDTVTLVGFKTTNCVIASAEEGERLGLTTEVLSDATGAIDLAHSAGAVDAETVHTTIMTLLNSHLAAVATTQEWTTAVRDDIALEHSTRWNPRPKAPKPL